MSKNNKIRHPYTGAFEYGYIHEIKKDTRRVHIQAGNIYLKIGEHTGKNKGFGLNHIWIEHEEELIKLGFLTREDVPKYVASILVTGAEIYQEVQTKLTILKGSIGIVVLEFKEGPEVNHYSVVSAYPKRNAHGRLEGKLK